jgi:hypothetical protein
MIVESPKVSITSLKAKTNIVSPPSNSTTGSIVWSYTEKSVNAVSSSVAIYNHLRFGDAWKVNFDHLKH